MEFVKLMSSASGRVLRILAGSALIVVGIVAGGGWYALSVIGLVPLLAGFANVCVLAPLFGQSPRGETVHHSSHR